MTLSIGRFGHADGALVVPCPTKWDISGNQVQVSGTINGRQFEGSTAALGGQYEFAGGIYSDAMDGYEDERRWLMETKVARQQLLGYVDSQEDPAVPVVVTDDPTQSGWYRVLSASVAMRGASLEHSIFGYQVTLERLGGYAWPQFESNLPGALRTNAWGVTSAGSEPWFALPSGLLLHDGGSWTGLRMYSSSARKGETVDIEVWRDIGYDVVPRWETTPETWFDGAATVETNVLLWGPPNDIPGFPGLGTPQAAWRPLVGRQAPPTVSDQVVPPGGPAVVPWSKSTGWRISNGLVRFRIDGLAAGTDIVPIMNLEMWDDEASQWEPYQFRVLVAAGGVLGDVDLAIADSGYSVVRNTAEVVTVRMHATFLFGSSGGFGIGNGVAIAQLDFTLRRGSRYVEAVMRTQFALEIRIGLYPAAAATALPANVGIVQTAPTARGNRPFIVVSKNSTRNLATGSVLIKGPSVTLADWGMGFEVGGTGAHVGDLVADLANQYMAAQSERVIPASR